MKEKKKCEVCLAGFVLDEPIFAFNYYYVLFSKYTTICLTLCSRTLPRIRDKIKESHNRERHGITEI